MSSLSSYLFRSSDKPSEKNEKYAENSLLQIHVQGRLLKSLKATRVATLLYVNYLRVVFGFPLASCSTFILHVYICLYRTSEKNCHILIGCIIIVSAYRFGSPRRKFSNKR